MKVCSPCSTITSTSDFPLVCVTQRHLVQGSFLAQLKRVLAVRPQAIILREKDLSASEYEKLAKEVLALCREQKVPCLLHNFYSVYQKLQADGLHLPLQKLRELSAEKRSSVAILGVSCHSLSEVLAAAELGAHYVTFGHVYATSCKPGLAPRGVEALRAVCAESPLPVYAIGGVTPDKIPELQKAGARGAMLMSYFMRLHF